MGQETGNGEQPLLKMEGITKVYGNGFVANEDVDFSLKRGEIHALAGENGAGKSTLMKLLFGEESLDFGRIVLEGREVKMDNPMEAIRHGIGMVHQHFMLAPSLTVAENMIMGMEPRRFGFLDAEKAVRMCKEAAKTYGFAIDPGARVESLPVGVKQKVEILKALLRGASILILDEPTAVLTPQETDELFVQLGRLKEKGHTIIFISHKLKEIKELCDRITILRHGKSMGEYQVKDLTEQEISRLMVGRDVVLQVDKEEVRKGECLLSVRDLRVLNEHGRQMVRSVSFTVRRGEILGIAGIEGSGQREIGEVITGLNPEFTGQVLVRGRNVKGMSIRQIRELSLSHIPEDRMTYGVSADSTIRENMISNRFYKKEYNHGGLLWEKRIGEEVDGLIGDYQVRCDDREQPVRMLSGGNIQKVVVARECACQPEIIIVNQPTRGIDVGAIEFVRKRLVGLRDKGAGLLLISADLNEILELSDSLAVLCEGEITAYFPKSSQVTEEELGEYMLGLKHMTKDEIGGAVYEGGAADREEN